MSFLYVLLAALGLGVLIFIHELGHYWVARRVGIKVEAFSIGFGRAMFSWTRDGVEWRVGWLPFGGYVRMAGTDQKNDTDVHDVQGGFFAARPIDRIKVALAGPLVNLVFAFLVFCLIWGTGGRQKSFAEFTSRIGWVDTRSELFQEGVRPGDIIESYDGHPYKTAKDHLYGAMLGSEQVNVKGWHVDYANKSKVPFHYDVNTYLHPRALGTGALTLGIYSPASYLIYDKVGGRDNPLIPGSPLENSGIDYGDRLMWMDGEMIFSFDEMSYILNQERALLTVERNGKNVLARVPRVKVGELLLTKDQMQELGDWQYELGLSGKLSNLFMIPYNLTDQGLVEGRIDAFDDDVQEQIFPMHYLSHVDAPLRAGDRIVAVDGKPVETSLAILSGVQEHQVHLIVERNPGAWSVIPWKQADMQFDQSIEWTDLNKIALSIGSDAVVPAAGNYALLDPIDPVRAINLARSMGEDTFFAQQRREIEGITDVVQKEEGLRLLDAEENRLMLGVNLADRGVLYNPPPTTLFGDVTLEMVRTFQSLFTGSLNPKWLSGPVGIVQVMHHGWSLGVKEALFWLGVISLNLGFLNLLPIPVLDGGQICFALYELISRKKLKARTMERLVIPFVIILVGFFIFVTFNDLSRLLTGLF